MAFIYRRVVRLADTDAAGVVYFSRILEMCHEAYEAALADAGIDIGEMLRNGAVLLPIVRAEADYLQPLTYGQDLIISLRPQSIDETEFALSYEVTFLPARLAVRAQTRHVCVHSRQKWRMSLPESLARWLLRAAAESSL
ncbi:putative thioesterase [Rubidibacter lacunae KORDI 51-2]|uniref:1,4-dihydroxy-2-naphthoyl-CoA hydrolase n=1 Tax=Rubidibacter lacunae KORDI 51-2 TaxID=582515 RepID=U5DGC5_9CHRO|nr:thioesterase family protein [Rubidibacter lacunae]ERN40332.1 putative thioesterase [Rubidibacter lacunae KORDI 51-2]